MLVGFTGTKDGMTESQREALTRTLVSLSATELHHGDCIGADAEASSIAKDLNLKIVIHPPTNPSKRSFCCADIILPPKPYLERNREIVKATDVLIAAPRQRHEVLRSGTWATVRHARKLNRRIIILSLSTDKKQVQQ